jgi:hypothetical protein
MPHIQDEAQLHLSVLPSTGENWRICGPLCVVLYSVAADY